MALTGVSPAIIGPAVLAEPCDGRSVLLVVDQLKERRLITCGDDAFFLDDGSELVGLRRRPVLDGHLTAGTSQGVDAGDSCCWAAAGK